ncbi:MAG TPA: hypothetical protein VFW95_05745 [Candidatus Limnocylindria bacterium]|nr:hypothetical protein [Candidatus Limnocylindria bacterium]
MIAAQRTAATPSPRVPSFTPAAAVLAIVLIVGVALLGTQLALDAWPPVHVGATSAVLGEGAQPCSAVEADADETPTLCYLIPFEEGREVGVGMTIRNEAPIPMTIVAADVIRDGVRTPAALESQLITGDETTFGFPQGVPFEPVEVEPGAERGIQFIGTYGDCDTVARDYMPGSGLVVGEAFLTLRWAFFETHATVPLTSTVALTAPDSCP